MKTTLKQLAVLLLVLFAGKQAFSATEIGGIYYNFESNYAVVTSNPNKYVGQVEIPKSVTNNGTEYEVKRIEQKAFYNCDGVTAVTLPNTIVEIGSWAFAGCGFSTFKIPTSVKSIGNYAFMCCDNLKSVLIPESVTSIGYQAFAYCRRVESLTMNAAISEFDSRELFFGCYSLKAISVGGEHNVEVSIISMDLYGKAKNVEVAIPNELQQTELYKQTPVTYPLCDRETIDIPYGTKVIPDGEYSGYIKLKKVDIPETVTKIGDAAFADCAFDTLIIPNSVKTIGNWAFTNCKNLVYVEFPESVTSIGMTPFSGCVFPCEENFINKSTFDTRALLWNATIDPMRGTEVDTIINGVNYEIYNGVVSVIAHPEEYVGNIVIADSITYNDTTYAVTEIAANAFEWSINMNSITLPKTMRKIGEYAFWGSNVAEIEFPQSVDSIGDWAFAGCRSITKLTIPATVTTIGFGAFSGCENIESLYYDAVDADLCGGSPFYSCNKMTEVKFGSSVKYIPGALFYECGVFPTIIIPENVKGIGYFAFYGCVFSNAAAFVNQTTLNEVENHYWGAMVLNDSLVLSPDEDVVYGVTDSMATVMNIPEGVTEVNRSSKYSTYGNLQALTIPSTVSDIDKKAFVGCEIEKSKFINKSKLDAAKNNYWGAIIKNPLATVPNAIDINKVDMDKVLSTEYYNVSGVKIANPRNGIFIARKTFSNGAVKTTRVYIDENGKEK